MSSQHAPPGHPHPDRCGSYPVEAWAVASGIISEASRFHLGTWTLEVGVGGLCWGLQDGPRVTASPQGRRRTWAPSSGRKGLRVLAAVPMAAGSNDPSPCRD